MSLRKALAAEGKARAEALEKEASSLRAVSDLAQRLEMGAAAREAAHRVRISATPPYRRRPASGPSVWTAGLWTCAIVVLAES